MDALGRYLIARFPKTDSAWVIAIGTNHLIGAVETRWETDLPAITPDGELAVLGPKDVTLLDPEKLTGRSTVAGGAKDFWYFFAWNGFRPRAQGLDQPVTFPSDSVYDSTASSTSPSNVSPTPVVVDTSPTTASPPPAAATTGFTVSFAALLSEDKAQQLANTIKVGATVAHVVSTSTAGSPIFRVVMGPFSTREEADKTGRASRREYWIYEGSP
jgi:cell division septation protein DedD